MLKGLDSFISVVELAKIVGVKPFEDQKTRIELVRGIHKIGERAFATEGASQGDGRWAELKPSTIERREFPEKPILQQEERLKKALTTVNSDSTRSFKGRKFKYEVKVPYAAAHQRGIPGHMEPRPPLQAGPALAKALGRPSLPRSADD